VKAYISLLFVEDYNCVKMRRGVSIFAVILTVTSVTWSQPTMQQTEDDNSNEPDTLTDELSMLRAKLEAMEEALSLNTVCM